MGTDVIWLLLSMYVNACVIGWVSVWLICRRSRLLGWDAPAPGHGAAVAAKAAAVVAVLLAPMTDLDTGALTWPLLFGAVGLAVVFATGFAARRWRVAPGGRADARPVQHTVVSLRGMDRRGWLTVAAASACGILVLLALPFAAASDAAKFARTGPGGQELIGPGTSWPGGWDGAAALLLVALLCLQARWALGQVAAIPSGAQEVRDVQERIRLQSRVVRGALFGCAGTAASLAFSMWHSIKGATDTLEVHAAATGVAGPQPLTDWVYNAGLALLAVGVVALWATIVACTRPRRYQRQRAEDAREVSAQLG